MSWDLLVWGYLIIAGVVAYFKYYRKGDYKTLFYMALGLVVLVLVIYTQDQYHWIPSPDSNDA